MSARPSPLSRQLADLVCFRHKYRTLHLTTFAFFLSFVVWFNYAPFSVAIGKDLGISDKQLVTLTLANLALTVPARIWVGMLLDRFGPRRVYAGVLIFAAVPNTLFATAHSFDVLLISRLLLGVVGAGFVVGIRLVAEWFDREEMGAAEGFYGGWGNFGSAAAALALPTVATLLASGESAWRWAVGTSGVVAAVYGVVFLFTVQDTPAGATYRRPRRQGALEVTSRGGVLGLLALQLPVTAALGVVTYRIHVVHAISATTMYAVWIGLTAMLVATWYTIVRVNRPALAGTYEQADHYPFRSVALLAFCYAVTFGTELTMTGLLPTYFAHTFGLKITAAGAAGSAFAFTNLVTRPGGGLLSDGMSARFPFAGRRHTLRLLLVGAGVVFVAISQLNGSWPLWSGITLVALASVFIQGGNGAVFAMVPLVKHRVSGQIAGIAGSYGNVGGVLFSAFLAFTVSSGHPSGRTDILFLLVAGAAIAVALLCHWLPEPAREGAERQAAHDDTAAVPAAARNQPVTITT